MSAWAEAGAVGALWQSSMLALITTPLFLPPPLVCLASVASNAAGLPNPTPRASRRGRGHNRSCLLLKKVRCRWWGRHCTHTGVCPMSGMGATVTGSCLCAAKKPGGSPKTSECNHYCKSTGRFIYCVSWPFKSKKQNEHITHEGISSRNRFIHQRFSISRYLQIKTIIKNHATLIPTYSTSSTSLGVLHLNNPSCTNVQRWKW